MPIALHFMIASPENSPERTAGLRKFSKTGTITDIKGNSPLCPDILNGQQLNVKKASKTLLVAQFLLVSV
ncbi:MAG TPA: hypothetical protein VIJ25_05550, partial [Methylococcales bacterium]